MRIPGFLFVFLLTAFSPADEPAVGVTKKINGVSLVAPRHIPSKQSFTHVRQIGADWVCVLPYAYGKSGEGFVQYDLDWQWRGETTQGAIQTIRNAQENRLKVALKPHIWVMGEGWTGDFDLETEAEWKSWESDYEDYILSMASVADTLAVELFCIGLELRHPVRKRPEFWTALIRKVRNVYCGEITYGANWDNFEAVPFWDELDYISLHAYFPLSQRETPGKSELLRAWNEPFQRIEKLSKKVGKPVLFTEYGYRSVDRTAWKQWELPNQHTNAGAANLDAQYNALDAIYEKFWNEPWFAGGFLWKWYDKHEEAGGSKHSGYTPQNKPAEKLVKQQFSQP